ncbi:MAG: tRNA (adenosine(37)-N6)-threonylcarbamoyltransferase complex dimerization subunit type 1 TsaB [Candidatus Omnitrophota bacterium]
MKILAIDTSTKFLSLGIYDDSRVYEYSLEVGPRLSSLLAVIIKKALKALGLEARDLDYFACGLGPGSFTGLRVGLSAMKGLSWPLGKPLIGVSTLSLLAMNAQGYPGKVIVPVIDARRNLVYSCFYRYSGANLKKISPYMLISKDELLKKIKLPCVMLGDALNIYKDDMARGLEGVVLLDKDSWYPKPHNIIKLALEGLKKKKFKDISKINPFYIYPKECQIKK